MVNREFMIADADLDAAIDVRVYEKVLNQLARENPGDPFWKKLQREFKQKDA